MGAMQVVRLREGLWQWGCAHPSWHECDDWDRLVWSTYFESTAATIVIDPLLPDDDVDLARFWRALDGDVERRGLPARVLLTCAWHRRSADTVATRYGAAIIGAEASGDPAPDVQRLDPGVPSPNREVAYRLSGDVLVTGDMIHVRGGELAVAPASWHDDTPTTAAWYAEHMPGAVTGLVTPAPVMILSGHGHEIRPSAIDDFARRHG